MSVINVTFEVYASKWGIRKILEQLSDKELLSFDTETAGLYSKAERKEAIEYLKGENLPVNIKQVALLISENSGLSFPSLVRVTHFVFGMSESHSILLICEDDQLETFIWEWVSRFRGKLIIHNTLFDLKIMYHRISKLPKNYEDTATLAKCLTNNVNTWKAKIGLKDLMSCYYDPSWTLIDEYEPEDLREPKFLRYAAIDGAATFKLWFDIQDSIGNTE